MQFDGTVQAVRDATDEAPADVIIDLEESDDVHAGTFHLQNPKAGNFEEGDKVALVLHGGISASGAAADYPAQILQADDGKLVVAMGQNHQAVLLKHALEGIEAKQPGVRLTVFNQRLSGPDAGQGPAPADPFAAHTPSQPAPPQTPVNA